MEKIAVAILGIFLSLSGCIAQTGIKNQKTDLVVIGVFDLPEEFFPWITTYDSTTMEITKNIFDSLVEFDGSFRILPKLAKSWNNPDSCTWRFFLRDDVTFHNGYSFTANDVKYTLDYIKNNQTNVLRDLLVEVEEVNVVNRYTIDIKTREPYPTLLNKLVEVPIASEHYLKETTERWPIGTGAYTLKEYVQDDYISLVKYDEYPMGHPIIKEAVFKLFQTEEDMVKALNEHRIDIMEHIPVGMLSMLANSTDIIIKRVSNPTVWYLSFDFRENSSHFPDTRNPFSDVRVRRAFYQAIDMQSIINKTFQNLAEQASQFLSPLMFGYNQDIERLPFDLNASRTSMKEAGYEHGFNLTVYCPEELPVFREVLEAITAQLSQIVSVNLVYIPYQKYYDDLNARNLSIYIMGWMPGTGDGGEIYDFLLRSASDPLGIGSCNFGYYSNVTVDQIGHEVTHTMNQRDRGSLMQEGFKVAMDDIACIPLYSSVCNVGISDQLLWSPRSDLMVLVEEIMVK